MARLEQIWLKPRHGGPMHAVGEATLVAARGLAGNADQGGWRQITLLSVERWREMMRALGVELDPSTRRANLLVSGMDFEASRGHVLRIGPCRLQIKGETRPCEQMETAHPGLREVMAARWGGGAFAAVLDSGPIAVGDAVHWEPASDEAGAERRA